jgi:4-amino-4-deoxy-L-arabinose transferase-like glycosyltransferase
MDWLEKYPQKYIVIALVLIGLALRLYASINSPVSPFDERTHMPRALGTLASSWQRLSTLIDGPVYYYATDISYRVLGYGFFAARLFPAIFSAASIALVYLLAKELYNRRTALLSALAFTFLASAIIYGSRALTEPMYAAFLLLSMLLFVKWAKAGDSRKLYAAAAFFGVAAATKIAAFYFLPAFAVYYVLSGKRMKLKEFAAVAAICILLFSPILLYNYFLYNDKHLMDFQFTRIFNIENSKKYFENNDIGGIREPYTAGLSDVGYRLNEIASSLSLPFWLLALVGAWAMASNRRKAEDAFLLAWLLVPLLLYFTYVFHDYYAVTLAAPMAIFAAKGIEKLASFAKEADRPRALLGLMLAFIAIEMYALASSSPGPSADQQLRDFAIKLPNDVIVLIDPKVHYTSYGQMFAQQEVRVMPFWMLMAEYGDENNSAIWGGGNATLWMYTVLCESDICAWDSRLRDMPGVEEIRNDTRAYGNANAYGIYEGKALVYRIYKLDAKAVIPAREEKLAGFFGQTIGEPESSDDAYRIHGLADEILNGIGRLAAYAGILLALSAPVLGFYLFLREEKEISKQ